MFSSWGVGSEVFHYCKFFHQQNNYDKRSTFDIASWQRIFTLHPCEGSVAENFQPWIPMQEKWGWTYWQRGVFLWLKTFWALLVNQIPLCTWLVIVNQLMRWLITLGQKMCGGLGHNSNGRKLTSSMLMITFWAVVLEDLVKCRVWGLDVIFVWVAPPVRSGVQLSVNDCNLIIGHWTVKHSSCEENYVLC